jgi:hypothetical protein
MLMRTWGIGLFVSFYLVTWVYGIPATRKSYVEGVLGEQGRATRKLCPWKPWGAGKDYPFVETRWSFAVLPGLILARREYQMGPNCASGGDRLEVWYGVGSMLIFEYPYDYDFVVDTEKK